MWRSLAYSLFESATVIGRSKLSCKALIVPVHPFFRYLAVYHAADSYPADSEAPAFVWNSREVFRLTT